MHKYGHIGTFSMGETGPHIAILVLSVVPHFNSMVYSEIPASCASVSDCGVVWDDRGEPPGYKVHPEEPPRLMGNQYSQRATTARFQWPRAIGSPSHLPLSKPGCRRTAPRARASKT